MGQAKRRGDYATRKAEGEAKAAQAEVERQERRRVEVEAMKRHYSTPKGRKTALLGSGLLALSGVRIKK
jgi:hypothetical protein